VEVRYVDVVQCSFLDKFLKLFINMLKIYCPLNAFKKHAQLFILYHRTFILYMDTKHILLE